MVAAPLLPGGRPPISVRRQPDPEPGRVIAGGVIAGAGLLVALRAGEAIAL
jgi:hypothetical protein